VKLLLDTNAFIMLVERHRLPDRAAAEVDDDRNELYLSLVSPWEMQIKIGLGKLSAARPVRQTLDAEVAAGTFKLLPITLDHIEALSRLPNHHRDPFDRLLIAQAIHEGLTIVTADETIAAYPVAVLWR
jgi:PIN domain nuclease of toxin-antitoxin system